MEYKYVKKSVLMTYILERGTREQDIILEMALGARKGTLFNILFF